MATKKQQQKKEDTPRKFWEKYARSDILQRRKILQKTVTKSLYRIARLFADVKGKEKEKEDFFNDAIGNWLQAYFDDLVEIWEEDEEKGRTNGKKKKSK